MSATRLPGQPIPITTSEHINRPSPSCAKNHTHRIHSLAACVIATETGNCLVRCILDRAATGHLSRTIPELCQLAASLVQLGSEIEDCSNNPNQGAEKPQSLKEDVCRFRLGCWDVHASLAKPCDDLTGICISPCDGESCKRVAMNELVGVYVDDVCKKDGCEMMSNNDDSSNSDDDRHNRNSNDKNNNDYSTSCNSDNNVKNNSKNESNNSNSNTNNNNSNNNNNKHNSSNNNNNNNVNNNNTDTSINVLVLSDSANDTVNHESIPILAEKPAILPQFLVLLVTKSGEDEIQLERNSDTSEYNWADRMNGFGSVCRASAPVEPVTSNPVLPAGDITTRSSMSQTKARLGFRIRTRTLAFSFRCWPCFRHGHRRNDDIDASQQDKLVPVVARDPLPWLNLESFETEPNEARDMWLRRVSLSVQHCFSNRFKATLIDELRSDLASVEVAASSYVLGRGSIGERAHRNGRTLPQYQQFQDVELKQLIKNIIVAQPKFSLHEGTK